MAKLSERQRLWLTIGASLLATGGVTFLVLSDREKIRVAEEEIAELEQRIEASNVEIRQTKDREDKVIVFRHVQARELQILPQRQQIADFHSSLTTFLQQAGASFSKIPENAPKESELARGVYVTSNTVEFTADSRSLLSFLNMIENDERLVAVKGLKVKGGGRRPAGEEGVVEHDVQAHLETYFYAPPADKRKAIVIPNEDLRLEEPGVKAAIAAFQPERRSSYQLKPATGRRDPFVDVRREVVVEDPEAVRQRFEAEEAVVADLERRHGDVREKAESEKALFAQGDLFRRDRLAQEVDALVNELRVRIANVASVKSVTFPDLVTRVERVRDDVEDVASGRKDLPRELTITAPVAEQTVGDVRKAFDAGDYAEVASIATAWDSFVRGKAVDPGAVPAIDAIRALKRRGKTRSEFQSKGVHVTGTIVNRTNPAASVCLVNGKVARIGETLDDRGDVKVEAVHEDAVDLVYEGETIRVRREDARRETDGSVYPATIR